MQARGNWLTVWSAESPQPAAVFSREMRDNPVTFGSKIVWTADPVPDRSWQRAWRGDAHTYLTTSKNNHLAM